MIRKYIIQENITLTNIIKTEILLKVLAQLASVAEGLQLATLLQQKLKSP
jgi:hypothetical protein